MSGVPHLADVVVACVTSGVLPVGIRAVTIEIDHHTVLRRVPVRTIRGPICEAVNQSISLLPSPRPLHSEVVTPRPEAVHTNS